MIDILLSLTDGNWRSEDREKRDDMYKHIYSYSMSPRYYQQVCPLFYLTCNYYLDRASVKVTRPLTEQKRFSPTAMNRQEFIIVSYITGQEHHSKFAPYNSSF
ncbi:unnamed protein product [Lasius platythorax]|uniref:Uncharacterized protein n=1 Tax=Lasius platythorax TaxID=488582 RepID=A0AAV2NKA9_9HYME